MLLVSDILLRNVTSSPSGVEKETSLLNKDSLCNSKSVGAAPAIALAFKPDHPLVVRALPLILLLLLALLHCGVVSAGQAESQLAWGVNAVVLKSPWSGTPSLDDLLADQEHTLSLNRFYRDGGQNIPATPTECRIAYSSDALLVVFRCTENNMSFPAAPRDAEDWYKLINLRSYADTLFPDQVDFLIQPDMASPSYYQFAMTPDGKKLGCSRLAGTNYTPGTGDPRRESRSV